MMKNPYNYNAEPKNLDFNFFPVDDEVDKIENNDKENYNKEGDIVLGDY